MKKKLIAILLVLSMLTTAFLTAIPASAIPAALQKTYVSKGYLLSVNAGGKSASDNCANGMSVVYFLSDGTFIIYDGGTSATDAKHLSDQLHAIAAEHGINRVVVSLWVITHSHGDHFGIINEWDAYARDITVKEFWFNNVFNSAYETKIRSLYPRAEINEVHAGEKYYYGDCELFVLYAADDTTKQYFTGGAANFTDLYGTNIGSGKSDGNQASYLIKMNFEHKSILMTGDAGYYNFEHVYNSDLRDELDADIFQVPHHGVGSASAATGARVGTPNNKHMAVISPDALISPSGRTVTNMVLSGSRALNNPVKQLDGSTAYDGIYRLYLDFGIVDAAGGKGKTFPDEASHNAVRTDGESYWIACWLDPNNYNSTKRAQCFFENVDPAYKEYTPEVDGFASIRANTEEGLKGSGIRFTSTVPADVTEQLDSLVASGDIQKYSFGTVIFKESSLTKLDDQTVTADALKKAGEVYADVPAVNGISRLTDANGKTYYVFNAAIINLKKANYDLSLGAVPYVELTLRSGATVRFYEDFDVDNCTSADLTAFQCITDLSDTVRSSEKFVYQHKVTETYEYNNNKYQKFKKVTLDSPKYCAYSSVERNILRAYMGY